MTTQTEPTCKAELPLNKPTKAINLQLNFVGYRKRLSKRVSFSGLCCAEALMEAESYARENRGKFVSDPNSSSPHGRWSYCEIEWVEINGIKFLRKRQIMFDVRDTHVTDIELELANVAGGKQ